MMLLLERAITSVSIFAMAAMLMVLTCGALRSAEQEQQASPSAARGLALALGHCSGCHRVRPADPGPMIDGVPSFAAIAVRPEQTAGRILGKIIAPHPPMPPAALPRDALLDVVAYHDSLRQGAGLPPLLPAGSSKPPINQEPT